MIHVIAAAMASSQESKEKHRTEAEELKDFAIDAIILLVVFAMAAGVAFLFAVGVEWIDNFTMTHNTAFDPYTIIQPIKEFFK